MLCIHEEPLNDPDKAALREWISHPGFGIYRRFLRSQAAIKQAESAETALESDQANDQPDIDARALTMQAKVIIASEKMLEQIQAKDYKFSIVTIKPEPAMLKTH